MKQKQKFNAKVIGKWMKGSIWKRPYLSVEFADPLSPKYYDIPVSMAFWNAVDMHTKITIIMEFREDTNKWHPV